jgi:hypothetical protein
VACECEEKLDIRPLADEDVSRWRQEALGVDPPSAPTLIKIDHGQAQAWNGLGMAIRLLNRLGPRATVRLLRKFGELRRSSKDPIASGGGLNRKDFLRLGTGAVAAVAFVALGKTPAFADPGKRRQAAEAWVRANPDKLPRRYDDLASFDSLYRTVIFQELRPTDRARLLSEHISRRSAALSPMSAEQTSVLKRAMGLLADERAGTEAWRDEHHTTLDELRDASIAAFGRDTARKLFGTIGPEPVEAFAKRCECSTESNWCPSVCLFDGLGKCEYWSIGCGFFNFYPCNGCCEFGCGGCCA